MRKLYIIGPITSEAYKTFSKQLDRLVEQSTLPISIELHSEGGSTYDGLAFYGKISNCPAPIIIEAHGMVHSAAIAVLAAGHVRQCSAETSFMVHESEERVKGKTSSLQKAADRAMDEERAWDAMMQRATHTPAEMWRQLHKDETYLTASQALQYGLIDSILKGTYHD